jgi:hypothetical protein
MQTDLAGFDAEAPGDIDVEPAGEEPEAGAPEEE